MYLEFPHDLSEDLAFLQEYCEGRFQPEPNQDRVHIKRIDLPVLDGMKVLHALLKARGLSLASAFHFLTLPRLVTPIHMDGRSLDWTRHCALNFPVANCRSTFMNWYANHPTAAMALDVTSGVPVRFPLEFATTARSWTPSHKLELTRPAIVRTDVWHNIDNSRQDEQRRIVSIRFEGNPTFEELTARLS